MSCAGHWQFPLRFLIKINEIWAALDIGRFLNNPLSKSTKSELSWTLAVSFTIPYQNQRNLSRAGHRWFPLQFLFTCIDHDMGWSPNFTRRCPRFYQNQRNLSCPGHGQFPLQFLSKINKIWAALDIYSFLHNSLSKSKKPEPCWTMSFQSWNLIVSVKNNGFVK